MTQRWSIVPTSTFWFCVYGLGNLGSFWYMSSDCVPLKDGISYRNYWQILPMTWWDRVFKTRILCKWYFWWSGYTSFGNPMQISCAPMWDESGLWGWQLEKRLLVHWCLRWNDSTCMCEQIYFQGVVSLPWSRRRFCSSFEKISFGF